MHLQKTSKQFTEIFKKHGSKKIRSPSNQKHPENMEELFLRKSSYPPAQKVENESIHADSECPSNVLMLNIDFHDIQVNSILSPYFPKVLYFLNFQSQNPQRFYKNRQTLTSENSKFPKVFFQNSKCIF